MGIIRKALYLCDMDAQEQLSALIPDPTTIVELVERMVEGFWPRSDADRRALFHKLGFTSGARWDDSADASSTAHFALLTTLPGELTSSWTSYNGHFMGVSMQPYTDMAPNNPTTRLGYESISAQLTELYGPPINPWHDPVVQTGIWNVNGRRIIVRFFNLQHSGIMLSVYDAGLATAADAESRRQMAPAHWNGSEERVSPFVLPRLGSGA